MQRFPVKRIFCATALFCVLLAAVILTAAGCAKSPRAEVDRLEALYGPTVSEVNALRVSGAISAEVYHDVITPARKSARQGLDQAKLLIAAGKTDEAGILLQSVDASLQELLQFLAPGAVTHPELKPPASRPTSQPAPSEASMGGAAALTLALTLLQNWGKIQPIITKLLKGEELTPEERALAELHSAQADAEADRLDAEAVNELQRGV
jgi:hypothetical protein